MGAKAQIQGFISRLLPAPYVDDRDVAKTLRLKKYGEVNVSEFDRSQYGYCEEGSLLVATNPTVGTGFTWSITGNGCQSFVDTAPQLYIFNPEPAGGKSLYLSHVKLIVTTAVTAATGAKFAYFMDTAARSFATDSGQQMSVVNPNGNASATSVAITCKMQNSATPSICSAIVSPRRIAQGWLAGTIPLIGDAYTMVFGRGDVAGHPGLTAVETTCRHLVTNHPPCIIPPQSSLTGHFWFPALTTAAIQPEAEIVMWAR